MSKYTDVNADGSSRQHNGDNYNYHYYGAGSQDASTSQPPHQATLSSNPSIDNGLKLWRAVKTRQLPRVRYLLDSGADVRYWCEDDGTRPLHQAALVGDTDILEVLLRAGANIDDEDREGATALHYAARRDVVITLIAAGADVDHEDRAGKTPGYRAHERSDVDVVEVLLNNHADPTKIPFSIGNGDNGRNSRQSMLKQHEDLDRMPAWTKAGLSISSMTNNLPNSESYNTGPERKLFIGISLENDEEEAAYLLSDRGIPHEANVRDTKKMASPRHRPNRVDYGIKAEFTTLSLVLDSDMPGLTHKQLEATNKIPLFIQSLHNYVMEVFAHNNSVYSLDNLQSEVFVTVPPCWSEKSRIAVTEATKKNGLGNVTLIRAAEAAALYTLHSMNWDRTDVGHILLICELNAETVRCMAEQVVSLKPFQLRKLGPAEFVWRRSRDIREKPRGKIKNPLYCPTSRAEGSQQHRDWLHEALDCIALHVRMLELQGKQIRKNDIEAILLVGRLELIHPSLFKPLLAGIEEVHPGVKVMHRRQHMAGENSVLATEAIMYGLLKNVRDQGEGQAPHDESTRMDRFSGK